MPRGLYIFSVCVCVSWWNINIQLYLLLFVHVAKDLFVKSLCLAERLQMYLCRFLKGFDGRYLELIRSLVKYRSQVDFRLVTRFLIVSLYGGFRRVVASWALWSLLDSFGGDILYPVGAMPIGGQLIPFNGVQSRFPPSFLKSGIKYYTHGWHSDNSSEAIEILDLT